MTTSTVRRYRSRAARLGYGFGFLVPLLVGLILAVSFVVTIARLLAYVLGALIGGVA